MRETGADQGDAGAVDAQARYPTEREREITFDKDGAGRNAPALRANSIVGRKQCGRHRGCDGYRNYEPYQKDAHGDHPPASIGGPGTHMSDRQFSPWRSVGVAPFSAVRNCDFA